MPPDRDTTAEVKQLFVQGNQLVHPSYNYGKDYIVLRAVEGFTAAAAEVEKGRRQVYVAIPELPIKHAFGDSIPYPVRANGHVCYKAPKASLHKLAYASAQDEVIGHYFIFVSAAEEAEHTKRDVTNLREGGLTQTTPSDKV